MHWKVRGQKVSLEKTLLMGILNLTPDSFSDGGKFLAPEAAFAAALRSVEAGADILDLGAESTRPGAEPVSESEELDRLLPLLDLLASRTGALISIDTTKPAVAEACLEKGAHMINDVSGLKDSGPAMLEVVKKFQAGLVLMHRRGTPQTMQAQAKYSDVTGEVLSEIKESLELASGLDPQQVVIDPGLGFAKTYEQNLEILRNLRAFQALGFPVLLGPSRKSFLGTITGRDPEDRDVATAAVCVQAVFNGVQILRVHDIKSARDAVRTAEAIRGEQHVRT